MSGPQQQAAASSNPFASAEACDFNLNVMTPEAKARYQQDFASLGGGAPKIGGGQVAPHFQAQAPSLPREGLSKIWQLSDIDKDGQLDCEEFCVGMHLVEFCKSKNDDHNQLPATLPLTLLPSSKY